MKFANDLLIVLLVFSYWQIQYGYRSGNSKGRQNRQGKNQGSQEGYQEVLKEVKQREGSREDEVSWVKKAHVGIPSSSLKLREGIQATDE